MSTRSRIVLGSLGGAFAIHLAALACSNSGDRPSVDASMVDGGAVQRDASAADGGLLDAMASVVDAVGDVVHDLAVKLTDGEVRDAHAGGDAGTPPADGGLPSCACPTLPTPPEVTFTATVERGRGTERPEADFSSATLTAAPARAEGGGLRYTLAAEGTFYLAGGATVDFSCGAGVTPGGAVTGDTRCRISLLDRSDGGVGTNPFGPLVLVTTTVPVFSDRAITVRVQAPLGLVHDLTGPDAGLGSFTLEVRATSATGGLLPPIPRQYRP